MNKSIRIGAYALCRYKGKIVTIRKKRGPFTGLLDLPGGKIEHREKHKVALARELSEELGLQNGDFEIKKLLGVYEDFVNHIWKGEEKSEHIIAIVYEVEIFELDKNFIEVGGDSSAIVCINKEEQEEGMTKILREVIRDRL